jgi:8-oxo-dGTP pyrophosphatase MutT (NUDIX family)
MARAITATPPGTLIVSTIAACVVLRGTGEATQTLLLHRTGPFLRGAWTYVAGRLKSGETAVVAARRELGEETGLAPLSFWNADTNEMFHELDAARIQVAPVFVARVADDAAVHLNNEHDDYRWLDLAAALDTVSFGQQRHVLRDVWDSFVHHPPPDFLKIDL